MGKLSRKLLQPFTDAVIARKREVKDGLLLSVDTGMKYIGLAVSDVKFTPRKWSPLGSILRIDYQPKHLLEQIQPEMEYPYKSAASISEELKKFIVKKKIIGLVLSISDPPQEVKDKEDYEDGTAHTDIFLEACGDVIGDIPNCTIEEHLTSMQSKRAAYREAKKVAEEMGYYIVTRGYYKDNTYKVYQELETRSIAQNRRVKLMFKDELGRTFLGKLSKDMCAAGRLLDLYIEFESATFTDLFKEDSFKDYFSKLQENENVDEFPSE